MKNLMTILGAAAMVLTLACSEKTSDGLPNTETTDTNAPQSARQTTDSSATTTGSAGGTIANLSDQDKEFAAKAGMSGLAEVQMGNLALQKAQSADVKAYAQRMVADHGRSNDELNALATTKGLALPTELDAEHKSGMDHLNGLSGTEFDKAYMEHMVADHQKAVTEFQTATAGVQDTELKGFAAKTLPVLQDHLQQATTVAGKVK
jgi:putative membrane protein